MGSHPMAQGTPSPPPGLCLISGVEGSWGQIDSFGKNWLLVPGLESGMDDADLQVSQLRRRALFTFPPGFGEVSLKQRR